MGWLALNLTAPAIDATIASYELGCYCNGARIGQCPFQGKGMFSDVDHTGRCGPQELSVIHPDGYCVPVVLI
ncbi:hypothetical protein PF011_g11770 [Phytophthora fragariae]|uniref:Uncharacterized protein n=1 Tax=Phytophthora fragariae TaxID=53985 RepID=A0A6A3KLW3_9STRA|nr:hypothetical protein PF011_g11770 [Phytophthora fragariae]